jgi:hypothetical protein
MTQRTFRLKLPDATAERLSTRERSFQEKLLNTDLPVKVSQAKLLADLLKRQARRILTDITECPPDTLPAHLARLTDWREIVEHVCAHGQCEPPEARRSGAQLQFASTLADWLAIAQITRQQHRAPFFVNQRDAELAAIHHKMDLLAGLVSEVLNKPTPEPFTNRAGEEERA